jgi:hypothetical protein
MKCSVLNMMVAERNGTYFYKCNVAELKCEELLLNAIESITVVCCKVCLCWCLRPSPDIVFTSPIGFLQYSSFFVQGSSLVCFGACAKFRKATSSFVMSVRPSVRPHGTTRVPLEGFSSNFIYGYFPKSCRENSSFIKICQE